MKIETIKDYFEYCKEWYKEPDFEELKEYNQFMMNFDKAMIRFAREVITNPNTLTKLNKDDIITKGFIFNWYKPIMKGGDI